MDPEDRAFFGRLAGLDAALRNQPIRRNFRLPWNQDPRRAKSIMQCARVRQASVWRSLMNRADADRFRTKVDADWIVSATQGAALSATASSRVRDNDSVDFARGRCWLWP